MKTAPHTCAEEEFFSLNEGNSDALHQASVHELRQHIAPPVEAQTDIPSTKWCFGVDAIDACLPDNGIDQHGLHELEAYKPGSMSSLTGFAFGMLSRLRTSKPIVWCVTNQQVGDYGQLYAFGLERYGISPAQIIFTKVNHPLQMHFAMEEALKTDGVGAVIGEGTLPNFTGSRRLALLCKTQKRPCLFLNPKVSSNEGSATLTRWQISVEMGIEDPHDPFGPGLPTWRVALPRSRGGRTMPDFETAQHNTSYPWRIVWDEQTLSFHSAALFSNRTLFEERTNEPQNHNTLVGRTG